MAYEERTPEDDRFDEIIKMEGLNIQSFHQEPPIDLFPNAQYHPEFFNQNLVNPNRVLKQFLNDPQSNIRVFYVQLLRLAFEVPTDSGYNHICLQNFKKIVFHPEFEILFTPDSESQRQIYNDFQFKKLFAEFISLLITASESEPPSIEQAIDQFPIIDIVLIHIIRSLLVSFNIKVAFDQKISTDLLFKELSSVLQLSLTSYGNCWKFEESDMFCYEENENQLYMAYIADDYYSEQTNNLQTIESVQNEERYIEDSFRSGYDNNLVNSNSGRNIIPTGIADDAKEEGEGLAAEETENWANELYHNNNAFGDVKMRLSDNEPPPNVPISQVSNPVGHHNNRQTNRQTTYQPTYQPPQPNKTYQPPNQTSHPVNRGNYGNLQVPPQNQHHQPHYNGQPNHYGPSYLGNQPTVVSHPGQQSNIDSMFSKIDNTLHSINNELATPQNIQAQSPQSRSYNPTSHPSYQHIPQSYSPDPSPKAPYNAPYNPHAHNQQNQQNHSYGHQHLQSNQISSSRTTERGYGQYQGGSERFRSEKFQTQPESFSQRYQSHATFDTSSKRQATAASQRFNLNAAPVKQPQYFKPEPYVPPTFTQEPVISYKVEKTFSKVDYNQDFTPNEVLQLLRPQHRQSIIRIKQYFRNLRRGSDFPPGFDAQHSIVRAASNVDAKSYNKSSSTYESRPYSVANPNSFPTHAYNSNHNYAVQSNSSFYS